MDKNGASLKTYSGTLMNENNLEIDEDEAEARIHAIRFEEHGGVYYNSANEIQKGKVRVCDLPKFIANKDTTFFEEEFEKLPYGLIKQYDQSQLEGNMAMNRYKGIYPYDESRVKVFGGHTDYINASFIDGYKKRNAFIATLGPMSKQLGDFSSFWRMIWQQKVDTIVMVTNLVEEGKDKCEQYWPNVESSTMYGDIRVSCTNEDTYAEFIRRTFVINLKKEKRNLYHLHFTAWPDKGIPEDVTSIVEFRQKVLNVPVVLGGPTVVHCSAGIGRTGTYIALDILIREGEAENMVDIPGCVVTMRQNRPNMVQTVEQYEYLHHALVHALTFDCKPVARDTFQKYMDGITHDMITRKFTQLHTTVSQRPSEEKEAESRNRNHRDKNRDGADIPGDENRPRLHLNLKPGASDYINAVYINSFRKAKQWILAQTPLPGTVNDFLTLALQENCSCIVGMEPDTEGDKTVGVYIAADNQIIKKGLFAVSGSDPVDNEYMTTRSMTISYRAAPGQPSKEHTIQHLQFTDWDMDRNEPRSPSNFMRFIKDVEAQASLHSSGPVLIHCLTGAGRGGLLCVVAMLTEMMMEVECEVSVVNAIRKIKTRRRGAVPNQEQFAFCHECILEYISSFDTYSNIVNNLRM
ncbi:receptor-type tyrosine-protein phosphatase T-like [Dreissena polymorpha]|nr:receptor-type tyrosine-protein phosphatase T-like [Dreissena polymorpha]